MRWILLACLLFVKVFGDTSLTSPPPNLPVEVKVGFYLLNFTSVNEKDETFLADAYFSFHWHDPRLASKTAFAIYHEEAAREKLTTIWRPHIEFINGYEPIYNNRTLIIHGDGNVEYHISITAYYYSRLNFTRFPFDTQVLQIQLDSFTWNRNILVFVPSSDPTLMYDIDNVNALEEQVLGVVEREKKIITGPVIERLDPIREFSCYEVDIIVKRQSGFFLYQIFIPLFLVTAMSCTVFFGLKEPFLDKVMVNLTSFLIIIAIKFALNLNLPEIGYLTMVDKSFLAAYFCIGLSIGVDALQQVWKDKHMPWAKKINHHARWGIFLLFVLLIILIYFLS